jgi:hypothetical protein
MIVRKLEALFTLNANTAQFHKITSELDNLASKAETIMKTIAGYWAVQALQNFVSNTANAMAEVGRTSEYLGISTHALQELRYAAEKSGVSLDALDDSLKELQIRAVDAQSGTGEAAEAFQMLGVKGSDAAGKIREPLELLDEVADKFMQLPTQSDRIWVADAIFGDEGAMTLKMLKEGALGIKKMREEARSLGIGLSSDSIAKATRFTQALTRLKHISSGISKTFAEKLLPAFSWLMEKCAALSALFNQMESRASLVRTTLFTLSGILTALAIKAGIAFGPMLLTIGLVGAGIAAVALLIDDLWVAFKGGDSVFLSLHKKARAFFGPIEQWLLDLPKAFLDFVSKGISSGLDWIKDKFSAFQEWLLNAAHGIKKNLSGLFDGLMPDFLKNGFLATMKMVGALEHHESPNLNAHLAPQPSSISHQNRVSSNQSVNVAVNVKSGANPHEIGSEVSKMVRKELERERFNAFMGVTQYAG